MFYYSDLNIFCNINCINILQAIIFLLLIFLSGDLKSQSNNLDSSANKNSIDSIKSTESLLSRRKNIFKKDNFKLGGGIFIEAQAAKSQYNFQQTPLNYIRTTLSPNISLWGLPFKSRINLTTEQFQTNYNLNRFQFELDINSLSQVYKNKLLNRLQESVADSINRNKYETVIKDSLNKLRDLDLYLEAAKASYDSSKNILIGIEENYRFEIEDSLSDLNLSDRLKYKEYLEIKENLERSKHVQDSLEQVLEQKKNLEKTLEVYNTLYKEKNPKQIQDLTQNPSHKVLDKYRNHRFLSRAEKFLLSVRDFKLGTIYTGSSSSSLQGATINGIALENSFGKLYTSIQGGLLQQNLAFGQLNQARNNNYLYTLKAGYGMPENTHLHLGYMRSGKIGKVNQTSEQLSIPKVESSTIYNVEGALKLNKFILLEGDWALANNEQDFGFDNNGEAVSVATISNQFLYKPNTSYSIKATSILFQGKTKVEAQQKVVGANFRTPGNIFLRNDIKRQKVRVSQKLYKSYISVDVTYQNDADNLLNQKSHTTNVKNYKGALKLRLKKLPSFILSYNLINQQTLSNINEQQFSYFNTISVYSITSVYSKKLKTNILTSSLTYIRQDINNNFSSNSRVYNNITATSSISNMKGDNITWVGTLSNSVLQQNTLMVNNQLEASYVYRKNNAFITTIGGNYVYDNFLGDNGGVFLRQVLSVWKNNSIAFLVQQNFFKGASENSKIIHQSIINIQFSQQW